MKAQVVSGTKDVMKGVERIGKIRYHYFDDSTGSIVNTASRPCSDILMIGVGTAMKVQDYDNLAESIVTKAETPSLVVVISDSNPGDINFIKKNSTKYANLAKGIRDQLNSGIIPVCTGQQDNLNFLIGGHSASGQAALGAVQKGLYDFVPDGFVGLDPYEIDKRTMNFGSPLQLPTLSWGFDRTTCLVQVQKAARGAYKLSSPDVGRVLYLIDNEHNSMTHCSFTDSGCGVGFVEVCPTNHKFEWVYESVAESINLFVNALKTDGASISKENFELPSTVSGNASLFVNSDDVVMKGHSGVDGSKIMTSAVTTQSSTTLLVMVVATVVFL